MSVFGDHYENFDPEEYLDKSFSEHSPKKRLLEFFHQDLYDKKHVGGRLLDLGAGPSVHIGLLVSRLYTDITLAEFADQNRKELKKWVYKDQGAYDWSKIADYISELENSCSDTVLSRTRAAIKQILPCDLAAEKPLLENSSDNFDCIVLSCSLECCFKDLPSYRNGLKNIVKLIKPGGVLVLFGALGVSKYEVGNETFHALKMGKSDVLKSVEEAGLNQEVKFETVSLASHDINTDGYQFFFLSTTKP